MADITRRFGRRHLRSAPTAHIRHHKRGRLTHDGPGLSFWYRSLSAALSEVPVNDRELAMAFHARTADFQDVTVQATVTYRISDPAEAATRIDFSIDPDTGVWRGAPLEQIATLLTETAQQHTLDVLARTPLAAALTDGVAAVRESVATGLAAEPRLPATGIDVVAVRVVAIRPEAEVERALRTPAREQIQQEADRATYERRAVAVERERAIAENELASQIELARREERLVDQRGTNARREAEEKSAADGVRTEAEAARTVRLASAEAEAARETGAARAEAQAAWLRVHAEVDPRTLHALAATRLADNLPRIDSLTLSPDVLTGLLAKLRRPRRGGGVSLAPRAVLVHRTTEYEELLARHGTHGQAEFFLSSRGRSLAEVAERHHRHRRALTDVAAAVPLRWRRSQVERTDLDRFLFGPEDVVVVAGQDGLVANAAKYLTGQPVVGIDTDPGRNPGVLVRHRARDTAALCRAATAPDGRTESLTMVEAVADDTQRLLALNEICLAPPGHGTARYRIGTPGAPSAGEPQASSGVLVGTGTGATGWLRSLWLERGSTLRLPAPSDPRLLWFVREAWPSPATGTSLTAGALGRRETLELTVESDRMVVFGDGMESDALELTWGQSVRLGVSETALRLVV